MEFFNKKYIFITRVISICIFAIIFLAMPIFCAGLKKGAHYIKNDTTNSSFYINEKGKIIAKSIDDNTDLIEIKDAFTNELLYIGECYNGARWSANKTYTYYNLDGEKLDFPNKLIIFAFNEYVFFEDGNGYNILLKSDFRLDEISDNFSYKKHDNHHQIYSFSDYVIINAYKSNKAHSVLTVYDKNLYKIKEIEECEFVYHEYDHWYDRYNVDGKEYNRIMFYKKESENSYLLLYNLIDGDLNIVLDDNFVYEDDLNEDRNYCRVSYRYENDKETNEYFYNFKTKKMYLSIDYKDIDIDVLDYRKDSKNNKITLIIDQSKYYTLDIPSVKSVKPIIVNNKRYIIISSDGHDDIYDFNGNLINTIESGDYTNKYEAYDKCIIVSQYGKFIKIYDENFKQKRYFDITGSGPISDQTTNYFVLGYSKNGKSEYYVLDKINLNYALTVDFLIISPDKSLIAAYDSEKERTDIYDSTMNKTRTIDGKIDSFLENNFLVIRNGAFLSVYDKDFKCILKEVKEIQEAKPYDFLHYGDEIDYDYSRSITRYGSEYEYNFVNKYYRVLRDNKTYVYDDKFNELYIYNGDYYDMYISQLKEDILLFQFNYPYEKFRYSLYKKNTGVILNDFYSINYAKKDYFTFQNGFYFGLMDYDLNILYSTSIFNSFIIDDADENSYEVPYNDEDEY